MFDVFSVSVTDEPEVMKQRLKSASRSEAEWPLNVFYGDIVALY